MPKQVGKKPYQTPRNADLGQMAYQDKLGSAQIGALRCNATAASAAGIISSNSGFIGLTKASSTNDSWYEISGSFMKIKKSGIVHFNMDQDFKTTQTTGYTVIRIYVNGVQQLYQLAKNETEWAIITTSWVGYLEEGDTFELYIDGSADIIGFDAPTWSNYTFLWFGQ